MVYSVTYTVAYTHIAYLVQFIKLCTKLPIVTVLPNKV